MNFRAMMIFQGIAARMSDSKVLLLLLVLKTITFINIYTTEDYICIPAVAGIKAP
jgi:hypothetical protein